MIPKDKLLHLVLGCIAAMGGLMVALIAQKFGMGPAIAFATTAVGVGYEAQQYVRREGQVEILDAVATASPGWLAWAFLSI